jgi:hypothetical protein
MSTGFDATEFTRSPWLHGADLPMGQPIELTIAASRIHEFTDGTRRPVVEFLETDQALSLNKTQTTTLVSLFGANSAAWVGQRVTLTAVPSQIQGKATIVIGRAGPPLAPTVNGQPLQAAPTAGATMPPVQAAPLGVGAPGVSFRQPGN